jgi:hypothetical protein
MNFTLRLANDKNNIQMLLLRLGRVALANRWVQINRGAMFRSKMADYF